MSIHLLTTEKQLSCAVIYAHYGTYILYSEIEKIIIFILNLSKQQDVSGISKNQSSVRFFGG